MNLLKTWAFHNLVAHPVMEALRWIGLRQLGVWVHDATIPVKQDAFYFQKEPLEVSVDLLWFINRVPNLTLRPSPSPPKFRSFLAIEFFEKWVSSRHARGETVVLHHAKLLIEKDVVYWLVSVTSSK